MTRSLRSALAALMVLAAAGGCATAPATASVQGLVVADRQHRAAWSGPATFTVRSVAADGADRVVGLPGVGEIHVGFGGDDAACRLVWSKGGLDRLTLFTASSCADRETGRLCFHGALFARAADAADPAAPDALVVDGCADENHLLWSKVDGAQPATVGPIPFRQRCARVPRKKGCELTYLKRDRVRIASNAAADQGFAFLWDGDAWRACFLEKETGAYAITLDVEDTCGQAGPVALTGDSAELDD